MPTSRWRAQGLPTGPTGRKVAPPSRLGRTGRMQATSKEWRLLSRPRRTVPWRSTRTQGRRMRPRRADPGMRRGSRDRTQAAMSTGSTLMRAVSVRSKPVKPAAHRWETSRRLQRRASHGALRLVMEALTTGRALTKQVSSQTRIPLCHLRLRLVWSTCVTVEESALRRALKTATRRTGRVTGRTALFPVKPTRRASARPTSGTPTVPERRGRIGARRPGGSLQTWILRRLRAATCRQGRLRLRSRRPRRSQDRRMGVPARVTSRTTARTRS